MEERRLSTPGQAVTGIVGAVVGYFYGGPAGAYYGFAIGLMVGGALFPPDIDNPRPTPNQLQIQTSMYGAAVPVVFGSRRVSGNLIWCGELQTHEEEVSSGGKGGGGSSSIKYSYTISMAWGLCMARDPRKTVLRAWAGKDEITDGSFATATIYDGSQTDPDPTIAADARAIRQPVWKNLCYVVLKDFPLGDSPVIPNFTFEVVDLEDYCFQNVAETEEPTNAGHRVLYAGGFLYVADDHVDSQIKVSKINPATLATVASITFPLTQYYLGSSAGVHGALLDIEGTERIALVVKCVTYSSGTFYILELSKSDLSVQAKIAVGDVVRGSDENLYHAKLSTGFAADYMRPITGAFWETYWEPLAPDTTIYNDKGDFQVGQVYKGAAATDCRGIYEDGYYYLPVWGYGANYLVKKSRADGHDAAYRFGYFHTICHGESGFLYAVEEVLLNSHIKKISKETLAEIYDYAVPDGEGWVPQILYENGYLYYGHRNAGARYLIKKLSTADWLEEGSYTYPGVAVPWEMILFGQYLVVGGTGPLTKLRKSNLSFFCSVSSEEAIGMAVDGSYLYTSNPDYINGHGITKFQLSGTGGDVTPQAITKSITTDPLWGLGLDIAYWDPIKTDEAEDWARDKDLLMSVVFDHQRSILDALQYVLQHHDGFITYMDGKIAHRQLTMTGAAPQFTATALSDNFSDGTPGSQWEVIR
jgi:hypothetical protein